MSSGNDYNVDERINTDNFVEVLVNNDLIPQRPAMHTPTTSYTSKSRPQMGKRRHTALT
jgi:hypothetical protein